MLSDAATIAALQMGDTGALSSFKNTPVRRDENREPSIRNPIALLVFPTEQSYKSTISSAHTLQKLHWLSDLPSMTDSHVPSSRTHVIPPDYIIHSPPLDPPC